MKNVFDLPSASSDTSKMDQKAQRCEESEKKIKEKGTGSLKPAWTHLSLLRTLKEREGGGVSTERKIVKICTSEMTGRNSLAK